MYRKACEHVLFFGLNNYQKSCEHVLFFDSNMYEKASEHVYKVLGKHVDWFLIHGLCVNLTRAKPKYKGTSQIGFNFFTKVISMEN